MQQSSILRAMRWVLTLIGLGAALAGCTATAPDAGGGDRQPAAPAHGRLLGSCGLALTESASDEEAIQAVLSAEGDYVVSQDIDALMQLWTAGATVVDAKNTPDDKTDDQSWRDKDAIRHRYVRTVFPGAPDVAEPVDLAIRRAGDSAVVQGTTHIGDETSPAGDRWTLVKADGCWLIESLTYNLEPGQP